MLNANDTWDLVLLKEGKKIIGYKQISKVKDKADGAIGNYKREFQLPKDRQTKSCYINYKETFALVAIMAILRAIIAIVASKTWIMH